MRDLSIAKIWEAHNTPWQQVQARMLSHLFTQGEQGLHATQMPSSGSPRCTTSTRASTNPFTRRPCMNAAKAPTPGRITRPPFRRSAGSEVMWMLYPRLRRALSPNAGCRCLHQPIMASTDFHPFRRAPLYSMAPARPGADRSERQRPGRGPAP
jgi:hypothetical protein